MATNTLAASGFNHAFPQGGGVPGYAMRMYLIAYNNSNQIGFGDPVKILNTGYIDLMATGGTTISGIFFGCRYFSSAVGFNKFFPAWTAPSLPSGTIVQALVVDDPSAVFTCQVNGGPLVQADIGNNIDITTATSGAPNSQSGISTCSLAYSTKNTTGTLPFKIRGIVGLQTGASLPALYPGYDPTLANNWVEVAFNTNALTQTTGI